MVLLNVGQEEKRKIYSCICYSKVLLTEELMEKLRRVAPVEISQKTVIRVLKRRPLINRKRTIFAMNASKLDDYHFVIKLQTQAGTYVKEFVHSDFGRTRPSISTLMGLQLGDVDILELDVEAVDLEWPPPKKS
uniref:tRNA pseudouridine(55) synthase n=1 Tax=Ditylenchus dipsaci TaxID=166011 RepID=A0A915EHB2_9BILA